MKKKRPMQPKFRLLKASCVGAGLLSISNPTEVTAADIGIIDLFNSNAFSSIVNPFPRSPLGVHVATGDLDGDDFAEIIASPGRGEPIIEITSVPGRLKWNKINLKRTAATGGAITATGDLDGDGRAELLVTSASGRSSGGSFLKFDSVGNGEFSVVSDFDDIFEGFSGGVRVAAGDLDGDKSPDFLAGRVNKVEALSIKQKVSASSPWVDLQPPLPPGADGLERVGGLEIAMGDVDGDGLDDVWALPREAQPGATITPFLLTSIDNQWRQIDSWPEPAGVHIAMGDIDGDSLADIIVGSPVGVSPYIQGYGVKVGVNSIGLPKITPKIAKESHGKFFISYNDQGVRVTTGDVTGDGRFDIVFGPASVPEPTTLGSIFLGFCAWLLGSRRHRRDGS